MRYCLTLLLLAAFAASMSGCQVWRQDPALASPRERSSFDAGWKFQRNEADIPGDYDRFDYASFREWMLPTGNEFTAKPAPQPGGEYKSPEGFERPDFEDANWRSVDLPHDWGIEGPFKQEYPGETGKLPWWGIGWYRKHFEVPESDKGKRVYLDLDGAMSYAMVWINGKCVGGWPFGYASWRVDLTPHLRPGSDNVIAIRLDNPRRSSRWYPGAGLYRHVWLTKTMPVRIAQWGVFVSTPEITAESAAIKVDVRIQNDRAGGDGESGLSADVQVFELDADGKKIPGGLKSDPPLERRDIAVPAGGETKVEFKANMPSPKLWSIESPQRYAAVVTLRQGSEILDAVETPFGIRQAVFTVNDGFHLNGKRVPINGVCDHHDLGALGAAVNKRAIERQVRILKEMGCNAIRTSHNPPAPELIEACDRMGMVVMAEAFDCWKRKKTNNDYNRLFTDWSEQDMRSLVRHYRNSPSVVLWSIGNEIREQDSATEGPEMAGRLVGFAHDEDPTRPTIIGCSSNRGGFNGVQKEVDVFGINYFHVDYAKFSQENATVPFLFSESASTVSSRGEYFFPVGADKDGGKNNFQMSSYDIFAPPWARLPDEHFAALDKFPMAAGEFVWTGFDYLGEPTPYNKDLTNLLNYTSEEDKARAQKELDALGKIAAPSRSSYFGIIDLAGFKKDRFYLYQARWRPEMPMAHLLPHWTWPGREGEVTPVHVYTTGDEAELFLNGSSLGRKKKGEFEYRLRWDDVKYAPGEIKVVAYKNGMQWAVDSQRTAGPAARLELQADRTTLAADGGDLAFATVRILDANGLLAPRANNKIKFEISGPASIAATDNGDATSFVPFQSAERAAFNGKCLAIVRTQNGAAGAITLTAKSDGLEAASITLASE